MAERVLMNEYKALAQESWTNIEVSRPLSPPALSSASPASVDPVQGEPLLHTFSFLQL